MSQNTDTTKYIQKLVKVISEKEKMIDKLKRNNYIKERDTNRCEAIENSIAEQKLRQELHKTTAQVKVLVSQMNQMQSKIHELTTSIQDEIDANIILRKESEQFKLRESQLQIYIKGLQKQISIEKNRNQQLLEQIEPMKLHQNTEELRKVMEQEILKKEEDKVRGYKVWQAEVGQIVESIFRKVKANLNTKTSEPDIQAIIKAKLRIIDSYVTDKQTLQSHNILNQTIDGISIIMKSFEEKLQDVHCLTDRQQKKCISDPQHAILKESTRSVPPILQLVVSSSQTKVDKQIDTEQIQI